MIKNRLEELKYSKNIFYGDEIYILPYHLISKNNTFNDLKKVIVTTIKTDGKHDGGCEVIGKVIHYDEHSYPVETYYSGHAIYRVNKDKIVTQDGDFFAYFDEENKRYYLSKDKKIRLYYKFKVQDGLYIQILISGKYSFKTEEEALEFSKKIKVKKCLLDISGITLYINKAKVLFVNYSVILNDKEFFNSKTKDDIWQYLICNKEPYSQNVYRMDYSKVFKLEPLGFVAK